MPVTGQAVSRVLEYERRDALDRLIWFGSSAGRRPGCGLDALACLLAGVRGGQPDCETSAGAVVAGGEFAVVRFDEAFGDRESQTGAAGAAGRVGLECGVEDMREVSVGDAATAVVHRDERVWRFGVIDADLNDDRAVVWGVADGVFDDVAQRACEFGWRDGDLRWIGCDGSDEVDLFGGGDGGERREYVGDEVGQGHSLRS